MRFSRKEDSPQAPVPATWPPASAAFGGQLVQAGELGPTLVNLTYELPEDVRAEFDRLSANVVGLIGDEATPYAATFIGLRPPAGGRADAVQAVNRHMSQIVSHGYKLGLVRLHLENERLGRSPRHIWRTVDPEVARPVVSRLAEEAWSDSLRIQPWVSAGALAPFSDALLMWAAIKYLALEDFKAIAAYYDRDDPMPSIAIPGLTAIGYAIARVQQEPDLMIALSP